MHDQGKMLVLPNGLLCWVVSTSDQDFVSFKPILCHPHTQIRIILFHDVQRDIPNLEFSPSHVSIGFSQNAFPIIVLPKDDRTDSFREERLGLPYWTMILAICASVDVSKCLDIASLEFLITLMHLPFSLGYKLILRQLLVLRTLAVWYPSLLLPSFEMLMILIQWILHKIQNHLSQCRLGEQLDLCIFGALSQFGILQMTDVHQWGKMNFCAPRPCFIDHLWFTSNFCQVPSENLFKFLPLFIHCGFCCGYLHGLRHRNKFVYQIVMLQWIVSLSCNMVLMTIWKRFFHTQSCEFTGFQDTRNFWFEIIGLATGLSMLILLACFARHSGSDWCFQFLAKHS